MRIVWQGFTDPSLHSAYTDRLQAYLDEVADPGTEFVFMGVSPPDRYVNRLTELRCAVQALRTMIERERDFDGMILGHFQDAGLWEARAALDVPVVGLGETSMLHACTLGYRVGLVTIHPTFIGWHEEQVRRYGLGERVVGVRAMETTPEHFMRAFEDTGAASEVRSQFEEQARALVDAGVEVLIPAGGLPALLFARDGMEEIDGAVVLNPTLVTAKHAELAVRLRQMNGTRPSRSGVFMRASDEARREFLEQVTPSGG
jgi:Asp/Glu/hydantoin racemase